MPLYWTFGNRRVACAAVVDCARRRGVPLYARPWNYHEPDNTAWWLVPSPEWPAYRHGKYFFDQVEEQSDTLICGVYIEKGLGAEVSSAYTSASSRRCIMQSNWAWFRLLNKVQTNEAKVLLTKLSNDISSCLWLQIDKSYLTELQSFDPYQPSLAHERYIFQFQPNSNPAIVSSLANKAHQTDVLGKINTIEGLFGALIELGKNPWLWVDFFVGLQFNGAHPSSLPQAGIWNSDTVWEKFLCKFLNWL